MLSQRTNRFHARASVSAKKSAPQHTRKLQIESLEARHMLSVSPLAISPDELLAAGALVGQPTLSEGTLTIQGTSSDDWIEIEETASRVIVHAFDATGKTQQAQWEYDKTTIRLIEFFGNAGNDTFKNVYRGVSCSIVCHAEGGDGNDTLVGGLGSDYLYGGSGTNSIDTGAGGNNMLIGGTGVNTFYNSSKGVGSSVFAFVGTNDKWAAGHSLGAGDDAQLIFSATWKDGTTTAGTYNGPLRAWTEAEVVKAMDILHVYNEVIGNYKILANPTRNGVTYVTISDTGEGSFNTYDEVFLLRGNFAAIHEFAHSWNNTYNPYWEQFTGISWNANGTIKPDAVLADFSGSYGMSARVEDWAQMVQDVIYEYQAGSSEKFSQKVALVNQFFDWLNPKREARSTVVTTLGDVMDVNDGKTSLREAIKNTAFIGNNVVTFAPGLFTDGARTLTLLKGELDIYSNITIIGPGQNLLTIDAGGQSRVMNFYRSTATLEGLSITGGNNVNFGSGIYSSESNLTITGCMISGNTATYSGGGISSFGGILTLINSVISDNTANYYGGGVLVSGNGVLTAANSTFSKNAANSGGGGVYVPQGSLMLTDCTVTKNSASYGGGIYSSGTVSTLNGSVVSQNTANFGGGIYAPQGSLVLTDCAIKTNSASSGGGVYINSSGTIVLIACAITQNSADYYGGGIYNSGTLTVTNCAISKNTAYTSQDGGTYCSGGGVYNEGQLTIAGSTISDNSARYGGGACNEGGSFTATDCLITENTSYYGGGIEHNGGYDWDDDIDDWVYHDAEMVLVNCVISENSADASGGGVSNNSVLTVTNCTIAGNSAQNSGGGFYNAYDAMLNLYNAIIALNTANSVADIYNYEGAILGFNNLSAFTAWHGDSDYNITYQSTLPLFVDAAAGDYRLAVGSQAIDRGDNAYAVAAGMDKDSRDLAGSRRFFGSAIDLGAYEFYATTPMTATGVLITSQPNYTATQSATTTPRIHEWQRFWLELWTETQVVEGGEFTITYDADLFVPVAARGVNGLEMVLGDAKLVAGTTSLMQLTVTLWLDGAYVAGATKMLGAIEFTPAKTAVSPGKQPGVAAKDILHDASEHPWLRVSDAEIRTDVWAVPYDLNDDGKINIYDLIAFAKTYGNDASLHSASDFNGDGKINIYDLIAFAKQYGMNATDAKTITIPRMAAAGETAGQPLSETTPPEVAAIPDIAPEPETPESLTPEVVVETPLAPSTVTTDDAPADDITAKDIMTDDITTVNDITTGDRLEQAAVTAISPSIQTLPPPELIYVSRVEPIIVIPSQVTEMEEVTPTAPLADVISNAIHLPQPLRMPKAAAQRDVHLYWSAYEAPAHTGAHTAAVSPTTYSPSRQREALEFLFAEDDAEALLFEADAHVTPAAFLWRSIS